ncbi:DUF4287 domain-containing protein [Microlunatus parietis]|uniref:DUF4287 domain-containing protein n=1 Tax=Microlunatus parietis TaxID=682979 RepID=A0A7Y9IA69_9ACTN|nr:DUF4287 domain-containing protein [Microlunatus parietis]NYE72831.1 hypothetical protein [Microlunatus parietis]
MSFQAYLDNLEKKTGRTPAELLAEAQERGITSTAKAQVVVDWLASEYGVGRGHAMALYKVIKDGATISDKHVGSTGAHRDPSTELRLDGIARR